MGLPLAEPLFRERITPEPRAVIRRAAARAVTNWQAMPRTYDAARPGPPSLSIAPPQARHLAVMPTR
ncbi:hypothetical protein ACFVGN_06405 [Streptomyces sp. NPDC057757]|uniref:hypothetical protein n=1 Tax=Streptomyces sp. NPDC057757 TaxID=3346241 RepID=UPI00368C2ED6